MARLDPDADHLRRRATRLRRTAFALDDIELWSVMARADDRTWVGPAATEFVDTLTLAGRDVADGRDELLRVAARLERRADELEHQARAALAVGVSLPAGGHGPR